MMIGETRQEWWLKS